MVLNIEQVYQILKFNFGKSHRIGTRVPVPVVSVVFFFFFWEKPGGGEVQVRYMGGCACLYVLVKQLLERRASQQQILDIDGHRL